MQPESVVLCCLLSSMRSCGWHIRYRYFFNHTTSTIRHSFLSQNRGHTHLSLALVKDPGLSYAPWCAERLLLFRRGTAWVRGYFLDKGDFRESRESEDGFCTIESF